MKRYPFRACFFGVLLVLIGAWSATAQQPGVGNLSLAVREGIQSDSVPRQLAALALLQEVNLPLASMEPIAEDLKRLATTTKNASVRVSAVHTMGRLILIPSKIVALLTPFLTDPAVEVRRVAAESLALMTQNSLKGIVRPLRTEASFEAFVVGSSWWILQNLSTVQEIDINLSRLEANAEALLPRIGAALEDSDSEVRAFAAQAFAQFAETMAAQFLDPNYVAEGDPPVKADDAHRYWILLYPTMDRINQQIPKLATPLSDERVSTRLATSRAVRAVAQMKRLALLNRLYEVNQFPPDAHFPTDPFQPGIHAVLPALAKSLKDASQPVRLSSMEAFEFLEQDALGQIEMIRQASRDRDTFVRWVAARTLGKAIPRDGPLPESAVQAIDGLAAMLSDPDIDVRTAVLTALSSNGPRARRAVTAVAAVTVRGDPEVRVSAIRTLEALKAEPEQVVPVLVKSLENSDIRVKKAAILALARIGPRAKAALDGLRIALNDTDAEVRRDAGLAIVAIDRGN